MEELNSFRKTITIYSGLIFKIGLTGVILSTLFLTTNLTSEVYETPKFLVLLIFTCVMLVFLMLKFTVLGKVVFTRTPLDIPLVLLLAVGIASTILSPAPYVSLLGNQLKISSSLTSLAVLILFYFILTNSLKNVKEIKWLLALTVIFAQVLAAITLLSYAGIKVVPLPWATGANFTPTGSSFSTTAILALLVPFMVTAIITSKKPLFIILNSLFLLLSGATIALTGTWATWAAALFGLFLTVVLSNLRSLKNLGSLKPLNLISLFVPLVLIALVIILSFIPPMGNAKNPVYALAKNFPREIQLGLVPSWKISVSAFRDSPFWGTGPSSYLSNFTNYKPVEFNSTKFWNLRFDSSFNEYLQILATLGAIGLLALLSLTALFISSVSRVLISKNSQLQPTTYNLQPTLAISGLAFFVILLLHTTTLPVWIAGILILASFMVANLSENNIKNWGNTGNLKSVFLRIAANVTSRSSSEETIKIDALPGVLLTVVIGLVLVTGYFGGKFTLADYHHRQALNAISQNQLIVAYNELVATEKLNPYNDLYRTDLAQANFALANAIALSKGPTEASPGGSLTDTDKQNIQVLLQQSINAAKQATALNPKSAINWEILGLLYRQIAGVAQNALVFSLDSYGRAIFQDPLNPALRVNVGGVYYAVKNYDMAVRFFTDAINLKPDFANAYYNLSVTLRDKGDLANAQQLAEKLVTLVDKDSPDYKVATEYLEELKKQTASSQATSQSTQQPPAAQTQGALQEEKLPNVVELPKPPEKIATPAAIKKPAATPAPSPQPTATP